MKLGTKILLSYLLFFGMGLYYITHGMLENIRFRYLEGVEDTLVDQSRILSSFISQDMGEKSFSSEKFHQIFDYTYEKSFSAKIYKLYKTSVDVRIYITDKNGIIIFDSRYIEKKGFDYSKWGDVNMTLQGKYGARSSREDSTDQGPSILYVASPILIDNKIAGVLTVEKPITNINNFFINAKNQIINRSIIAGVLVILSSIIIMLLITRPIKLFTQYANNIRIGEKTLLPKLNKSAIGDMGRAFDKMREALE